MEPESPSPYPQVPATCPCPEPTTSSAHDPLQLPDNYVTILNLPSSLRSITQNSTSQNKIKVPLAISEEKIADSCKEKRGKGKERKGS